MSDLASVCLTGRMTRDAKTRQAGNHTVTEFSLAVNGWRKDSVSFFNVEAWGKLGEIILRYGVKGKQLAVSGTIRIDTWEKEGFTQRKPVIDAKDITLLGSKDTKPAPPENTAKPDIRDLDIHEIPF